MFGLTHNTEGEVCAEGTPDAPPALPVMDEWSCMRLTELCISRNEPGIISETYDTGQSNLILAIRLHKLQTEVFTSDMTDVNVTGSSG